MRVLSLRQPWAWVILHLGKRVENRTHNLGGYRGPLLLHASLKLTSDYWEEVYEFVRYNFGDEMAERIPRPHWDRRGALIYCPELPVGHVVGIAELMGHVSPEDWVAYVRRLSGLGQDGDPEDDEPPIPAKQEAWYMTGQHAFLLDEKVREFKKPVPCKGSLGFFRPPAQVLAQLRKAKEI